MSRCRFVQPQTVRLPLSDGDWIEIKQELTAGEQRQIFAGMVREFKKEDGRPVLEPAQVGRTKVVAYLVGWSLLDAKGQPVDVSESAIDAVDFDTYAEIEKAIDGHVHAQELAHAKKATDGKPTSGTSSPSVK